MSLKINENNGHLPYNCLTITLQPALQPTVQSALQLPYNYSMTLPLKQMESSELDLASF